MAAPRAASRGQLDARRCASCRPGAYNRVEGLPIELGPVLHRLTPWGSVRFDGAAVLRTGSSFGSRARRRRPRRCAARCASDATRRSASAARLFNVVDPVESWQLCDLETALAAFLVRRDYRDYYQRHGGQRVRDALRRAATSSLTGSYGDERWASRDAAESVHAVQRRATVAAQPAVDEGLFHVGDARAASSTRAPIPTIRGRAGRDADIEHGRGHDHDARADVRTADARRERRRQRIHARLLRLPALQPPRPDRAAEHARRARRLARRRSAAARAAIVGRRAGRAAGLRFPQCAHRSSTSGTCNVGASRARAPGASAIASRSRRSSIAAISRLNFTGDWEDWPRRLSQRARRRRVGVVRRRGPRMASRSTTDGIADATISGIASAARRRSAPTSASGSTSPASASTRRSRCRRRPSR